MSSKLGLLASTSNSLQLRQIALTMSRSSAVSSSHPRFGAGKLLVLPVWLTLRKQPFAVVHGGNPNCARYTARSASAFGYPNASTTATVVAELPVPLIL